MTISRMETNLIDSTGKRKKKHKKAYLSNSHVALHRIYIKKMSIKSAIEYNIPIQSRHKLALLSSFLTPFCFTAPIPSFFMPLPVFDKYSRSFVYFPFRSVRPPKCTENSKPKTQHTTQKSTTKGASMPNGSQSRDPRSLGRQRVQALSPIFFFFFFFFFLFYFI